MSFHLETERLIMQPWADADADALQALHAERGGGTPTLEQTREIIAHGITAAAETGIALLPIRRRSEGDFIGYCGLTIGRATIEEPEIAYELFKRVHGNGYATEAARAVLDAAAASGSGRPSAPGTPHPSGSSTRSASNATTSPPTTAVKSYGSPERCPDPNQLRRNLRGPASGLGDLRVLAGLAAFAALAAAFLTVESRATAPLVPRTRRPAP
jgi:hypothetical protein